MTEIIEVQCSHGDWGFRTTCEPNNLLFLAVLRPLPPLLVVSFYPCTSTHQVHQPYLEGVAVAGQPLMEVPLASAQVPSDSPGL